LNLLLIPEDAVGIPAADNENPTELINTQYPDLVGILTERSDTMLKFTSSQSSTHGASYLGCIVSADRQTIYWVNNSKPLP
jgi:hypothetical protein